MAAAGINPLVHYLTWGAAEGRDPSPLFDTSYYLKSNPDVAAAGINPLAHYLTWGAAEGRDPKARPSKIRLEASSICQLRCPSCPIRNKAIHSTVGSGFLKIGDFTKLLDENRWVREIELSNYGEIFLNPDLLEIMKYAYEQGVILRADNRADLNDVKDSVLEGLVRYKFGSMTVLSDGAGNKSYRIYRVGGDFDAVIRNVRKINQLKEQARSEYPRLAWQFVVFGHNEHEIESAEAWRVN